MEHTIENKAKFFALYWGQDVFRIKDGIDNPGKHIISNNYVDHLVLKNLSDITDKDAIEVFKIIGGEKINPDNYEENSKGFFNQNDSDQYIIFEKEGVEFWVDDFQLSKDHNKTLRLFDYLRLKGYALPYNGLSVEDQIEYGWIKLTN